MTIVRTVLPESISGIGTFASVKEIVRRWLGPKMVSTVSLECGMSSRV